MADGIQGAIDFLFPGQASDRAKADAAMMNAETARMALARQGQGANAQAQQAANAQKALQDASNAWQESLRESGGDTRMALQRFIQTPQFFMMGPQAGKSYMDVFTSLQQGNTREAFDMAPGHVRYIPDDNAPGGPRVAGPVSANTPPGYRAVQGPPANPAPGPLDAARVQEITRWTQAGNTAAELEPLIPQLEQAIGQPGGSGAGMLTAMHNMWRSRLGLGPSTDPATLINAIRTRFVPALHGTGIMTDSDRSALERALPDIGNSVAANRQLVEIMQRTVTRAVQRGEIAAAALQANTPQAVEDAFKAVSDPQYARRWEQQWVSRNYGIPVEELQATNAAQLRTLNERIMAANGGMPPPPRVQRYLRDLAARIQASGR